MIEIKAKGQIECGLSVGYHSCDLVMILSRSNIHRFAYPKSSTTKRLWYSTIEDTSLIGTAFAIMKSYN